MSNNTYIVIFPSFFAKNKIGLLMANIKKILKIQNQNFTKVSRDGNVILVDANDPVFASSTIGLLFGIKEIIIARQIKNDFKSVVDEITKVGSSLLLKGEKFYVSVDGKPKGYMIKDVELSATSSLIEKNKTIDATPGTKEKHDKLLFTHITKSNAYVSIFDDKGLGGTVNNSQNQKIICGIYDEFSAIACLEAIKQGFEIKIIVFYKNHSDLITLVKILSKILPRTLKIKSQIDFCKVLDLKNDLVSKNFLVTKVISNVAINEKILFVSLPISPLMFPSTIIKKLQMDVFALDLTPIIPLSGIDSELLENLKEVGMEKYVSKTEKLLQTKITHKPNRKISKRKIEDIIKNKKSVAVKLGPNMVHDILDSVENEH